MNLLNLKWKNWDIFKINMDDIQIYTSERNIPQLEKYLIQEIDMNEKKVYNTIKKLNNIYKATN